MKRLKGLGARRSSFEIPKGRDGLAEAPKLKKLSQVVGVDSSSASSSPRKSATGRVEDRRSVDERCGSAALGVSNEKLLMECQQVLSVPGNSKSTSVRGVASRRSSFSSSSDFQSSSSSRPSDASSVNCSTSSFEAVSHLGRNVEQAGRAILVAFDANARDAVAAAVEWAFLNVLKSGDALVLLGVMDFIRGPLGYKCQVNDQTWLGANKKLLQDEIAAKKLLWSSTPGLRALCETREVKLLVEVKPAQRPEVTIVQDAVTLGAVEVILDKSLNNRRRKYYLERLRCGVTRMRRSGGVEVLRASAKEAPASPTSVIPSSEFVNRPASGAAPALAPSASLRDDEEELFTIDHCRHRGSMSVEEPGYESDDLFSICGDGGWRTSSFASLLHQRPGAETQSARNSTVAAHDHDPGRPSVDSSSRLDNRLLSLTRLQLGD
ncbi:hypothetical protein KC19_12G175700 [Ceratodon purpureus]|uniref:Uncharacterized protein n=1 Tax=Ceratodon purpureus TaxID=3225 RepID=A0A8T0GC01_CERPU|nr:hypothetical protein KC19_12G175700 [Ceratodon purpureus]